MAKYMDSGGLSHFMGLVKDGIDDAVDAIEVGGRNLWLGTGGTFLSANPKAYSGNNSATHSVTTDPAYPGREVLSIVPSSNNEGGVYGYQTRDRTTAGGIIAGEVYTISFDIKASDEGASVRMTSIAEMQTIINSISGNDNPYPITTVSSSIWLSSSRTTVRPVVSPLTVTVRDW